MERKSRNMKHLCYHCRLLTQFDEWKEQIESLKKELEIKTKECEKLKEEVMRITNEYKSSTERYKHQFKRMQQDVNNLKDEIEEKDKCKNEILEELHSVINKYKQISEDRWKRCNEIDMLQNEIKKLKEYQNMDTKITNTVFTDLQLTEHEELVTLRISYKLLEYKFKELQKTNEQIARLYLNLKYGKKEEN